MNYPLSYEISTEWPSRWIYFNGKPDHVERSSKRNHITTIKTTDWELHLGHKDNPLTKSICAALADKDTALAEKLIYNEVIRLAYLPDHSDYDHKTHCYSQLISHNGVIQYA